jgi:hypothetical protein
MPIKKVTLTVSINSESFDRLKIYATYRGRAMSTIVDELIMTLPNMEIKEKEKV